MIKQGMKTRDMIITAMFTAVLVICAQIAIPTPWGVPVTMQPFAYALAAGVLGWKRGTVATLIYVLLGAVGIPVYAEFTGGIGILAGMTGGFLLSAPVMACLCGIGGQQEKVQFGLVWNMAGLLVCHLAGIVQFAFVTGYSLQESALLASLPYLLKDIVIVAGAYVIARTMVPRLRAAGVL